MNYLLTTVLLDARRISLSKWLSPIPRGALEKRKCEGALREGLLQVGLQSFLQRVLPPNETPSPEVTPKGTRNAQNDSPNDRTSSKMKCWGASWATLGAFG